MMEINYPHHMKLEQMLLGALLSNNKLYYKVNSDINPEHFYEPLHGRIYTAINRKISDGLLASPVTIKLEFDHDPTLEKNGGADYLVNLARLGSMVLEIKDYAAELLSLAKRRRMIDAAIETIEESQNVTIERSASDIEADALKRMFSIAHDSAGCRFETNRQVAARVAEKLRQPLQSYSTGIKHLDNAMLGGMEARRMYAFSGRMKDGKSIWATTIAYNMDKLGTKLLFLSLEMENDEIQTRCLAREMGIKPSRFYYDRDDSVFQEKVSEQAAKTNKNIIMLYEPDLTFERMKQRLHAAVHNCGIKGFILDQWQLVGGKRKGDTTANHLSEVAQWLAGFCKSAGVFGMVICQLNKDGTTLDSEGIKRAADQHYLINRCPDNQFAYLDLEISRYTPKATVGSESNPSFRLNTHGLFFEEL